MAGINGTPVHRLSQTRELVLPHTEKDFLRLVILMGTQKSHSAYRLAWDNSSTPRIPFLPLHRRDLVSAEEGNRTFVGHDKSRINWRKFEVMGEVVVGLQLSQQNPYPHLNKFEDAERLILDIKLPPHEEVGLPLQFSGTPTNFPRICTHAACKLNPQAEIQGVKSSAGSDRSRILSLYK